MHKFSDRHKSLPRLRRIPILLLIIWMGSCHLPPPNLFLTGFSLQGFDPAGPLVVYNRGNLFDYMNGEAEVYLPLGFQLLYSQSYEKKDSGARILVDAYDMGSPEGSRAVFAAYTREAGSPVEKIGESAWTDNYFVLFRRGSYFFRVWPDPLPDIVEKPRLQDMIDLSLALDSLL